MNRERLEDLLAEFLERREAGEPLTADAFAVQHPEGGAHLLQALRRAAATDGLLPRRGSGPAPATIGGFRVIRELGRGGTSAVFLVRHPDGSGPELALKLLHGLAGLAPRALERLRREASALQGLQHPAVVRVHGIGDHDGQPFLLMDHVPGESLAARVQRARERGGGPAADRLDLPGSGPGWQRACGLVAKLARAVQAAHDRGVLHRDLKPGNVILREPDGEPVLIDFGLARAEGAATLTATGDVLGTPCSMAPEQARGRHADARTDVHGLGGILYELLTLCVPHPGTDPATVMDAARRLPPRPVRRLDPSLPRRVEDVVRRAMALRPARRHRSAAGLAAELEVLAEGGRPARARLGWAARLEDFWRWHDRALRWTAAGLLAVLLAVASLLLWSGHRAAEVAAATRALEVAHLAGSRAQAVAAAHALLALDGDAALGHYVLAAHNEAGTAPADAFHAALLAGERHLQAGEEDEALSRLRAAAELRPGSGLATALLGIAAAKARDHDLAQAELTAALRLLPGSTRIRSELAWVHRHRDELPEAERLLRSALELDPRDPDLWHDLGRILALQKQPEAAHEAVDRALELAGGEPLLYLRTKGVLCDATGQREQAIAILQRIVERHPTAANWGNLGRTLDSAHRLAEARDAYLAAVAADPGYVPALLSLCYLHSGSNREECAECRAALAAQPGLIDAAAAEDHALQALAADPQCQMVEQFARYALRVGPAPRLRAEVERLLQTELPDAVLGRLLKARRLLSP